jgi:flagellar motor switch protein FliM
VLTETTISMRDLMNLKPGDVIPIDLPEVVTLRAEDIPVFRGRFGVSQGNRAIKITDRVLLRQLVSTQSNN